jgi:hypothetical protein
MTLRLLPKVLISDTVYNKVRRAAQDLKHKKSTCTCWRTGIPGTSIVQGGSKSLESTPDKADVAKDRDRSSAATSSGDDHASEDDLKGEGLLPGDVNLPKQPQTLWNPPIVDAHGQVHPGGDKDNLSGTGGVRDGRSEVQSRISDAIKGLWQTYQAKAMHMMDEVVKHPNIVRIDTTGMIVFKQERSSLHIATALALTFQRTSATIPADITRWINALIELGLDWYIQNEQLADHFKWWLV